MKEIYCNNCQTYPKTIKKMSGIICAQCRRVLLDTYNAIQIPVDLPIDTLLERSRKKLDAA